MESIVLIRFLPMSLVAGLTLRTSWLFICPIAFIFWLMVDWVRIKLIQNLIEYFPILIILIFVRRYYDYHRLYIVCLMMLLLLDPYLLEFFRCCYNMMVCYLWLGHRGLVRWLDVPCWCFKRKCNILSWCLRIEIRMYLAKRMFLIKRNTIRVQALRVLLLSHWLLHFCALLFLLCWFLRISF